MVKGKGEGKLEELARDAARFLREEWCDHALQDGGEGHCIACEPIGITRVFRPYVESLEADLATLRAENERQSARADAGEEAAGRLEQEAQALRGKLAEAEARHVRDGEAHEHTIEELVREREAAGQAEARVRVLAGLLQEILEAGFGGGGAARHPMWIRVREAISPASEQGKEEPALCTNRDCEAFGEPSPHSEHAPAPSAEQGKEDDPSTLSQMASHESVGRANLATIAEPVYQWKRVGSTIRLDPEPPAPSVAPAHQHSVECLPGKCSLKHGAPAEPPKLGTCGFSAHVAGLHGAPHSKTGYCIAWTAHDPEPSSPERWRE